MVNTFGDYVEFGPSRFESSARSAASARRRGSARRQARKCAARGRPADRWGGAVSSRRRPGVGWGRGGRGPAPPPPPTRHGPRPAARKEPPRTELAHGSHRKRWARHRPPPFPLAGADLLITLSLAPLPAYWCRATCWWARAVPSTQHERECLHIYYQISTKTGERGSVAESLAAQAGGFRCSLHRVAHGTRLLPAYGWDRIEQQTLEN